MNRSVLIALVASLVITVLPMTIQPAASLAYVPGVTAGQTFTYSYVEDYNPPEQITIHVKAVSGSIVNYSVDNGAHVVQYNVSYIVSSPWYFVGINLNPPTQVHGGASSYPITGIVTNYPAAGKNWTTISMVHSSGGITYLAYWDQVTGIMLHWHYQSSTLERTYNLVSIGSDSSSVPMEPGFVVASLLAGVVVAIISMRKKQRPC